MTRPQCVVIAGPNGAGKTSAAPELLKDTVGVAAFVNADVIAEGLAAFRLPSPELAAARVKRRVALGGHDVAEDVIRRRHARGLRHLRRLLDGGVTTWRLYDASAEGPPRVVAFRAERQPATVVDEGRLADVRRQMGEMP
jgi:predicted ABC-type ATPase